MSGTWRSCGRGRGIQFGDEGACIRAALRGRNEVVEVRHGVPRHERTFRPCLQTIEKLGSCVGERLTVELFGSRGRGDFTERSDVDLIVVEAAPFGPGRSRHQVMNRLYRAVAGLGVPADILAYSLDDVDYWRDSLNHVLARALREGTVLYERS